MTVLEKPGSPLYLSPFPFFTQAFLLTLLLDLLSLTNSVTTQGLIAYLRLLCHIGFPRLIVDHPDPG